MPQRRRFLAAAAAFADAPAVAAAQTLLPLRIGATPNDTYAEAYYGAEMGIFKKAGLDVDLTTLNNGAAVAAAVAAGTIDVGVSGPVQTAQAFARGVPFTIVAAGAMSTAKSSAALLCVPKDSPLTAHDLEGKAVAVNALKTTGELGLDVWLVKTGIDVAKVRVVEVPMSEMGNAVARGTIAAAVISEPALSIALRNNNLRVLGDPMAAISPELLVSSWFSTTPFVQKNPETIRRFASAMYDTARWANAHQFESAAILAKVAKMDVDLIRAGLRAPYAEALRPADIQVQLDVAAKYGLTPRLVNASELVAASTR